MGSWRESSVNRKLLRGYKKKYPDIFADLEGNEKIEALMAAVAKDNVPGQNTGKELEKIISLLHKSLYRIRFHRLEEESDGQLFSGFTVSYEIVSAYYMNARFNPKSSNLHNFRKKTKDFLYQLFYFREPDPQSVRRLEKKLNRWPGFLENTTTMPFCLGQSDTGSIPESLPTVSICWR